MSKGAHMFTLFGIQVQDLSPLQAVQLVLELLKKDGKHLVVTLNPEIAVKAYFTPNYMEVIQKAGLVLPDGTGIILASYFSLSPLKRGRVRGRDLVEELVRVSCDKKIRIVLLGGSINALHKTTQKFSYIYENNNIVGSIAGPEVDAETGSAVNEEKNHEVIKAINGSKPDILLVGFGHPKQELWINRYLESLNIKVAIGVGGSFDYFAGVASLPPRFMARLGLEWMWRLGNDPKRLKRILIAVLVFPCLYYWAMLKKLFHVKQ